MMKYPERPGCPECGEELDWLDTVINKITHAAFQLYICHNGDCVGENLIYNDKGGVLQGGDPSGLY